MKKMKNITKKLVAKVSLLVTGSYLFFMNNFILSAAKSEAEAVQILKETDLYKGGISFLGAASTILIAVIDAGAVVLFLVQGFKYMNAEEELKAKYKKSMITIIIIAASLTTARVLVPAIISIFQG